MVRGGRVPDLPGVRYHTMRFKKDFMWAEDYVRTQRRSKFGVKNPSHQYDTLNRRLTNKSNRNKRRKIVKKVNKEKIKKLCTRLKENFITLLL